MKRKIKVYNPENISLFKKKLFKWSNQFNTSICLDSNNYNDRLGDLDAIVATDVHSKLPFTKSNSLNKLESYLKFLRSHLRYLYMKLQHTVFQMHKILRCQLL